MTCAQLAMQPACEAERERAEQAEVRIAKLQADHFASLRAASDRQEQLEREVRHLKRQIAKIVSQGFGLPAAGASAGEPSGAGVAPPSSMDEQVATAGPAAPTDAATAAGGVGMPADTGGRALADPVAQPGPGAGVKITDDQLRSLAAAQAVAVVIITCKRPQYLKRSMDSLLGASRDPKKYPLILSQDGFDETMTKHITSSYVDTGVAFHVHHEHEANAEAIAAKIGRSKQVLGYTRIAQHYGFAMRLVFDGLRFEQAIFLEEDMELSPDFFSYFGAMLPLLQRDPDLYCVSAWNDNGARDLVEDPKAAFRTDSFPGLGWMMQRSLWDELRDRWAQAYWDEFMRRPDVRKGRHCIRPEVSRSYTFGEEGTSAGQFYREHLSRIKLNDVAVDWSSMDLGFLASKAAFDEYLQQKLREATESELSQAIRAPRGVSFRVRYDDARNYVMFARAFHLMEDEKEGIRRMSYRGVIPFAWKGSRIFLYTSGWPGSLR
eukprot:CAMPEP_0117551844 /NCGR_PEP_ID=MMETSP0784-20121206/49398_1 /TAXON_ID=39447 /ORGANISM="" /LENGTH=491 /DNA_ID=CAMNT_0005348891 /DNA_START=139 /DNA_END=1614 /DNA_ORIENTATION=-